MKPKADMVLGMCVENGVQLGWNRAHKHDDSPPEQVIRDKIAEAVMNEVYEWFDFGETMIE